MTINPLEPDLTLIGACAHHRVIGRDNQLPWRLPEDLRHFKASTMGACLVMGRRTFDSIGRPLPGRTTIVISRDPRWSAAGCLRADSLETALSIARTIRSGEIFAAGGEQIYRLALPRAARVLLTEIELEVQGDAHFPELDRRVWIPASRDERVAADGTRFAIVDYRRRDPA